MFYRSKTEGVSCRLICLASRSGMPARTMFRMAVRRRSWKIIPGMSRTHAGPLALLAPGPVEPQDALALAVEDPRMINPRQRSRVSVAGRLLSLEDRQEAGRNVSGPPPGSKRIHPVSR